MNLKSMIYSPKHSSFLHKNKDLTEKYDDKLAGKARKPEDGAFKSNIEGEPLTHHNNALTKEGDTLAHKDDSEVLALTDNGLGHRSSAVRSNAKV